MQNTIGIVILTYNQSDKLSSIFESISNQTIPPDKIVIIDNNSTEKYKIPKTKIKTKYYKLKYEDEFDRRSEARNIGAAKCKTDIILFLDGDTVLSNIYIEHALAFFSDIKNKKSFLVGNRFDIDFSDYNQDKIVYPFNPLPLFSEENCGIVISNNISMFRNEFLTLGGFDTNFKGWGFEDTEFFYRAFKAGYKPYSGYNMLTIHFKHMSNSHVLKLHSKSILRNTKYFLEKHPDKEIKEYILKVLSKWSGGAFVYNIFFNAIFKLANNNILNNNTNKLIDYEIESTKLKLQNMKKYEREYNKAHTYLCDVKFHKVRYQTTINYIHSLLEMDWPIPLKKILILGDESLMDRLISSNIIFKKYNLDITISDYDLREKFHENDNTYDLIICTEVLEHLKDPEASKRDMHMSYGIINCFKESARVLKPNGIFFATTPNAISKISIYRLLIGKNSYAYRHHVKEYTPRELHYFFNKYFDVLNISTVDMYKIPENPDPEFDIKNKEYWKIMDKILNEYNFNNSLRNDTTICILNKPNKKCQTG